jgi:hypothetical protein
VAALELQEATRAKKVANPNMSYKLASREAALEKVQQEAMRAKNTHGAVWAQNQLKVLRAGGLKTDDLSSLLRDTPNPLGNIPDEAMRALDSDLEKVWKLFDQGDGQGAFGASMQNARPIFRDAFVRTSQMVTRNTGEAWGGKMWDEVTLQELRDKMPRLQAKLDKYVLKDWWWQAQKEMEPGAIAYINRKIINEQSRGNTTLREMMLLVEGSLLAKQIPFDSKLLKNPEFAKTVLKDKKRQIRMTQKKIDLGGEQVKFVRGKPFTASQKDRIERLAEINWQLKKYIKQPLVQMPPAQVPPKRVVLPEGDVPSVKRAGGRATWASKLPVQEGDGVTEQMKREKALRAIVKVSKEPRTVRIGEWVP